MLHQAHTNCSKQASFSKLLIIQLKIKILSEGLWQQILYQNLRNLSNYWSVKQSRGLFLFKRNEKQNRKGTLTPKMPFAAKFSCCATIDFNSILKYFPRGLWWLILYQNLWNLSNYWSVKQSRGLFLFKRNEKKNRKGTLTPKMRVTARFSCCATIDFNSILKYFPRGLWWYILYQNLWNLSNCWSVKNRFYRNFTECSINHRPVLRPVHGQFPFIQNW